MSITPDGNPHWDQDETAVADRYGEQDPGTVASELTAAAADPVHHLYDVTGVRYA